MRFEREGKEPIDDVSEKALRQHFGRKVGGDNSFAVLERADGSYLQMLGGGISCCMEWRDMETHRHLRAYINPPRREWRKPTYIGRTPTNPDQCLFIEDVTEAFCAFLTDLPFPSQIQWRNITEALAEVGVARPAPGPPDPLRQSLHPGAR
jgi:hypothetical protein